jgi:hypothetical protein
MKYALFWDITQRRVIILYRSFGKTYWFYLQGPGSPRRKPVKGYAVYIGKCFVEDGTERLSRNVGKVLPLDALQYTRRVQTSPI